jgi:hypothetical protein
LRISQLFVHEYDTVGEPSVPAWQNDKIALDLGSVEEFTNGIEYEVAHFPHYYKRKTDVHPP